MDMKLCDIGAGEQTNVSMYLETNTWIFKYIFSINVHMYIGIIEIWHLQNILLIIV